MEIARTIDISTAGDLAAVDPLCVSTIGYLRETGAVTIDPVLAVSDLLLEQFRRPLRGGENG